MNTKTALILGAGREQQLAIQEARLLGYRVIALDGNPLAAGFSSADEYQVVDIRSADAVIEACEGKRINGVFCHGVEIPDVVAKVARHFGLPGLDPAVAEMATDKSLRIRRLSDGGVPVAAYAVITELSQLESSAEKIGYPLVIKPEKSSGARGVQCVYNQAGLTGAYAEALLYSQNSVILLEELLQGPELSTEALVYKGKIHTFAIADRNYARSSRFAPYFIEDGINFPSSLPEDVLQAAIKATEDAIRCLGINFGSAKGDVLIHKGEAKIIEMACRSSGGWFGAGSIPLATGINMLKPLIQMSMGDEPDMSALEAKYHLGCAQRYLIPTESGTIAHIRGVKAAKAAEGVRMAEFFPPAIGSKIHKATNHAERFGQVICTAATQEDAIRLCEQALQKIEIGLIESTI